MALPIRLFVDLVHLHVSLHCITRDAVNRIWMPIEFGKYSDQCLISVMASEFNNTDERPPKGRIIFSQRVKWQLYHLQRGKCRYCGRTNRIGYLEIDHKYPVSRGGGNEWTNLQLLCRPCNMRKGIQSDEEFRDRYRQLLPKDGTPPNPPVRQEEFSHVTSVTRASPEVRSIYYRRFTSRRQQEGRGCLLVIMGLIALLLMMAILFA